MTNEEFQTILNNNYANIDGINSEIINLEYFERQNQAVISFKQERKIFNNAKLVKIY